MSLRFVPPEPLQGHGVAEAATRSGSVPGISGPDSPRLDEEDCWSGYRGGGSHATGGKDRQRRFGQLGAVGENRQRRFFDEQGLDDGLSRPGRKIRPGDTLTKQRWSRHWGSGSPRDSVGRFGSSVCFGSVGLLARWADASADSGSAQ